MSHSAPESKIVQEGTIYEVLGAKTTSHDDAPSIAEFNVPAGALVLQFLLPVVVVLVCQEVHLAVLFFLDAGMVREAVCVPQPVLLTFICSSFVLHS